MVAFYLYDTKKILAVIFLSYLLTAFTFIAENNGTQSRRIEECLELDAQINKRSAKIGEEVELTVMFRNKTDAALSFYPQAPMHLFKSPIVFGSGFVSVNDTTNLVKVAKIEPGKTYSDTYRIVLEQPFFFEGLVTFQVSYRFKELTGKLKKYNKLYGRLESLEISIMINKE
jgi:hypothetical protein